MKTSIVTLLVIALSLLATCGPLSAHHGNTAYDNSKVTVLKPATVTEFIWANPHSIILFDVKDAKGKLAHWSAEGGSPSSLSNLGWNRNTLQPGDVITVYVFPSKLGTPVGRLNKIVRPDGTKLMGGLGSFKDN